MPESSAARLPPNWSRFLLELDGLLDHRVELHCIGGFVLVALYGLPRATSDIDYILQIGSNVEALQQTAGEGSPLARRHGAHLQYVAIHSFPENYAQRLTQMKLGGLSKLALLAPDPYDLVLTKLAANRPVDRDDVKFLAQSLQLRADVLRNRYQTEMRNTNLIGDLRMHDLTLKIWCDEFFVP